MSCVISHVFHVSHGFRVRVRLGLDLRLDYVIGEMTHPCHTTKSTENQFDRFPSTVTLDLPVSLLTIPGL